MWIRLFLILTVVTFCRETSAAPISIFSDMDERIKPEVVSRWASAALSWVVKSACKTSVCMSVLEQTSERIRVFAAASPQPVMITFLTGATAYASGASNGAVDFDGALVLDPTPRRQFGHPLLVFGVNVRMSPEECKAPNNTGIAVDGDVCLHLLRPSTCYWSDCDTVQFLPLVTHTGKTPHVSEDLLLCRPDIRGFASIDVAPCPNLSRDLDDSNVDVPPCNPFESNIARCVFRAPPLPRVRCSPGYLCDHAILIYGQWNHQQRPTLSLERVYDRLRQDGFKPENIATFVGGGDSRRQPAHKLALRSHMRRICEQSSCIGNLLVLVAGVATPDGSILLRDVDRNGRLSDLERYTPQELVKDLRCQSAERIFIIVDHRYPEPVIAAANVTAVSDGVSPRPLGNVVIVSAAENGARLIEVWLNGRTGMCTNLLIQDSKPVFEGSPDLLRTTSRVFCERGGNGCFPLANFESKQR